MKDLKFSLFLGVTLRLHKMENQMENRMHYEMEFRLLGKTMMQEPIQLENTWATSSVQLLFCSAIRE